MPSSTLGGERRAVRDSSHQRRAQRLRLRVKTFLTVAVFLALPIVGVAQTDLQGIWQAKGTAYIDLEKFVVEPRGGTIPYRADARAKRKDNFQNRETADTVNKCYLPGV